MSVISASQLSGASNVQSKPAQSAASTTNNSVRTALQQQRLPTLDLTDDGSTDIIVTSPEATAVLSALNAQLSPGNTQAQALAKYEAEIQAEAEEQKENDAKQLKAALEQLHILELLGLSLGPEKLAKEVTDLAKQIAGIAKDYADNSAPQSGAAASTPSAAASASSEANTVAAQANGAASTQATGSNAATPAAASADQASQTAKAAAETAAKSTQGAAGTAQSAPGTASPPAASSPPGSAAAASAASQSAASDPDKALADSPDAFFAEITAAFKDLKKLETRALAELTLSPDQKKKNEAKKLGGEFNDAVQSVAQSASASGVSGAELASQTIDLSKVTLDITV